MRRIHKVVGSALLFGLITMASCSADGAKSATGPSTQPASAPDVQNETEQAGDDVAGDVGDGPGIDFDGLIESEPEGDIDVDVTPDVAEIDVEAFPVVLAVEAATTDGMSWRFDVTLSSPYDTPERYADAWRVLDRNDVELGIRILGHDHASEQPFTRSQSGIIIAEDAATVFVEGRDQANGWSGQRFRFELQR